MSGLEQKKLDVRLIALDLDDTLLDSQRKISDKNVAVLKECARRGIYVVLCSGRAEDGILPYVRRLDIAGTQAGRYLIAINGCSVFDLHAREQIYCRSVEADVLLRADEEAEKAGFRSEVYSPDTIFYREETKWTRLDVDLCGLKGKVVENYREFLSSKPFPKMLIPGEAEQLVPLQEKLKSMFGESAVIFTSKPYFLEVLPPNCGKGEAIKWLASRLNIPVECTMGFGDSMNDENMIRECGYGVVMKNGLEQMKKIAAFVTDKTNDESGVGDFIEKYVL